jgi:prefoldin subunit 5
MDSNEAAELREQLQKLTDAVQVMQLAIEEMGRQIEELQRSCRVGTEPSDRRVTTVE